MFYSPGLLQISNNRKGLAWPINVDPGSPQSFQLMRTWIQECVLEHGCGISDHSSSMPTFLLSVDRVDKYPAIRLIELMPGEKHQYLALSYCWGRKALNEGANQFSRLGMFTISDIEENKGDYYGGDFSTADRSIQTFIELWGGKDSIQEIVLV